MSEPKLISPMLDNFDMGDPISHHNGVRCCPAMEKDSDKKYIVKIISIPASQVQLDALLITGAYQSAEAACAYFKELSDSVVEEAQILQKLSGLEGFLPYESWQVVPKEQETGYDVYLLSPYRRTLEKHFRRNSMTHLGAVNLGLDLCAAMAVCRHSGYLYADLKPGNVCIVDDNAYRICDLGFIKLDALKYASLPEKYHSQYTAPEISDAFSALNATIDIYAAGLILYQAYNDGILPFKGEVPPAEVFPAPAYADYEMAEIILKACAPDPKDRWQDPIQTVTIDNTRHLPEILDDLRKFGTVTVDEDMVIICVVGDLEWQNVGFESQVMAALKDIPVRMVSYGGSNYNISLLVRSEDKVRTLKALSQELF